MTDSEMCQTAAEIARAEVLKECKRARLSVRKLLKRISEGLDAKETKTSYDKEAGQWAYSKPLINHTARIGYANLAAAILGIKANEKLDVEHKGSVAVVGNLSDEDRDLIREGMAAVKEAILEAHRASISKES